MLLQILIFILPAILYSRLKGERFGKRMRLNLPRFEHTWFLFCILAVMITGSLLTCILTGGIASLTGDFTLYNTFTAHSDGGILNILAIIIAYALLPAFGEELIFRSYLCAEYEHLGVGVSITVSALFFAMLHFSLPLLLTYLFLGALLAAAMYATRSLLAVILLHAGYNIFCLFGQPYLSAFYLYAGSNDIFLFFLITLFLLFSAFAAGEARKIYHIYAISNRSSDYTSPRPLRTLPRTLWHALKTPTVAVCLTLWLVMSLVDLLA
jgi:membrane protease YdiL (CAAX protease family)